MYENGLKWNELKKVSGIKQKRTLENKIRHQEAQLEEVFKKLFSRVKYPFNDEVKGLKLCLVLSLITYLILYLKANMNLDSKSRDQIFVSLFEIL
jgi:hypothetical protein